MTFLLIAQIKLPKTKAAIEVVVSNNLNGDYKKLNIDRESVILFYICIILKS